MLSTEVAVAVGADRHRRMRASGDQLGSKNSSARYVSLNRMAVTPDSTCCTSFSWELRAGGGD